MSTFKKTILAAILLFAFFSVRYAFAATIYFETPRKTFSVGEEFLVQMSLDTNGESINAVEGKLLFPSQYLEVAEVRDGNSIVNFWAEHPTASSMVSINFSGIIPSGYQGSKGLIFAVLFRAKSPGISTIYLRETRVLKNDGKGTLVNLTTNPISITVSSGISGSLERVPSSDDTTPPEKFNPEIAQNSSVFNGDYFLVFATQDKGSGIDHYEVREGMWGGFSRATSPYRLNNQKLDEKIFIKAIDKNGNERTETLLPKYFTSWYNNYVIILVLALVALLTFYSLKKFHGKNF